MEDRGTLWTLLGPHGTFLNIAETHRTLSNLTELWRLLDGVLDLPEHFWCVLGGETVIFRYFQNIFRNCVNVQVYFRPLENLPELWRAISYLGRLCGAHGTSRAFWCSLWGALRRLPELCNLHGH